MRRGEHRCCIGQGAWQRPGTECQCDQEPPPFSVGYYAVTFDPYFRCAACFDTPSIVPISDQLRSA